MAARQIKQPVTTRTRFWCRGLYTRTPSDAETTYWLCVTLSCTTWSQQVRPALIKRFVDRMRFDGKCKVNGKTVWRGARV